MMRCAPTFASNIQIILTDGRTGRYVAAHILVIDDDERLRDLLQRFLSESGFLVTAAGSAEEARAF